jgi:hypothetical protein
MIREGSHTCCTKKATGDVSEIPGHEWIREMQSAGGDRV